VRPGLPGSWEELFHQVGEARFWLPLRGNAALAQVLREKRLQRAIGVIYLPQSERTSHYFHTRLPAQFDAMIHIDRTRALEPLVAEPAWHAGETAETYPSGL
jgi:erythromycin esterase-like protein